MRFCYGHRRFTLYPQSVDSWNLNPDNYTGYFLKRTKDIGFDDGDGTSLTDLTGNGNDGTINGPTWADGAPLAAPVTPDPEIFAVNVDIDGNDVSISIDATGDFSHYHWRLDWDGEVISTESTTINDLWYGLH